jgi:hypothetical protein
MMDHAPAAIFQDEDVRRRQVRGLVIGSFVAGDNGRVSEDVHYGLVTPQLKARCAAENLFPGVEYERAPDSRLGRGMKASYRRTLRPQLAHAGVIAVGECPVEGRVGVKDGRLDRLMCRSSHGGL